MGLLDKKDASGNNSGYGPSSLMVKDCINKVGFCEYVTDPDTDILYRDTILFEEKDGVIKKNEQDLNGSNVVNNPMANENNSNSQVRQPESCSPTSIEEEVISSALIQILGKLDIILDKLSK
jgi:hypothetical protein